MDSAESDYQYFTPPLYVPDDLGEKGECLANSLHTALNSDLDYAEGIAKSSLGIWYRHAWNVDAEGRVIDFTWRELGMEYLGRIIAADVKWEFVVSKQAYWFETESPFVPEGEMGLDCLTEEQARFFEKARA